MKIQKTNAMRLLTQAGIAYDLKTYPVDENDLSGVTVGCRRYAWPAWAESYITLVARGDKTGYLVCIIPVDAKST